MLTFLGLWRERLITKETMVNTCKGKMINHFDHFKQSIFDDLEGLFARIAEGIQDSDHEKTYFMPKVSL